MSGFTQKILLNTSFLVRRQQRGFAPVVNEGVFVKPLDPVLTQQKESDFVEVGISQHYRLTESQFKKGLLVNQGDKVRRGDFLFRKVGALGIGEVSLVSPVDGEVSMILNDRQTIILAYKSKSSVIPAFYKGRVSKVLSDGVEIEGFGHLLQCVYGVGGEVYGPILNLKKYQSTLMPDDIQESMSGYILVGAKTITPSALKKAKQLGVKGIVVAHAEVDCFGVLGFELTSNVSRDIGFAFCLTERFSECNYQSRVIDFFESLDGSEASVNAKTQIRAGSLRPEIWVWADKVPDVLSKKVFRVIVEPYWNLLFESADICPDELVFESGISALGVKLQKCLNNPKIRNIVVPSACIEEIEVYFRYLKDKID